MTPPVKPSHEEIAKLAYFYFENAGFAHGHDREHHSFQRQSSAIHMPNHKIGNSNKPLRFILISDVIIRPDMRQSGNVEAAGLAQ